MVERTLNPNDDEARNAPRRIRQQALAENKSIKQIVWDSEGGATLKTLGVLRNGHYGRMNSGKDVMER